MSTMTVDIQAGPLDWSDLLHRVREGEEIILVEDKMPIARLAPILHEDLRTPGLFAGGIGWISDDFDEPLPDEFWAGDE